MTNNYSETDEESASTSPDEIPDHVEVEAQQLIDELEHTDDLTDVSGVGANTAQALKEAGFETTTDLQVATQEDLVDVDGVGVALATYIKVNVGTVECADIDSPRTNVPAELADKGWLSADECLLPVTTETHIGEGLYHWVTDTYIPSCSLREAYEDEDVMVGDVEDHDQYGFRVNLYYVPDRDVGVWTDKSISGQSCSE